MEHPLVAPVSKGSIWRLQSAAGPTLAIEWQGKLVDAAGQSVDALEDGHVSLWHPLESDAQTVRAWRAFVEDRGFRQPLKQAHREAFRLGIEDGLDECGSTRFAGHVVRQDLFAALCRSQGWHYALQGPFASEQEASIELPRFGLVARLEVPFVQPYDPSHGLDPFVSIGTLSFEASRGGTLALRDVPPRLFSETMRDVSLFVSVASVANTPDWRAAPPALRRYYRDATFPRLSETGIIRRDFIERRRGDLPHSDRLSLDDRALVVRGDLHTDRIHLDTAEILIAPDGPLLAFPENVGPRTRPELDELLPFADGTLSLVLSNAALLARDAEIDDAFVRVQLAP
jgi:hypothetical protein